jgi:DNA (cytosine-5)-methyltransferase 1
VADLFCGAGGSSSGAKKAIEALGFTMELVAVNHWPVSIETHQRNHPLARHYVEDVTLAKPEECVPGGRLDLLMASPECIYHSRARGGKPIHDQGRMNAWAVHRWLTSLDVRCLLVENVPEFVEWGPLCVMARGHAGAHTSTGKRSRKPCNRPDPRKKGAYYAAWRAGIEALGYKVDTRVVNAANHGDATTRNRFFLQARKDRRAIRWPEASHFSQSGADMFGARPRWRAAREIIDWSNRGRSIFDDPKYRKRPLASNTLRRISRGLELFSGPLAPLYLRLLASSMDDCRSVSLPNCANSENGHGAFVGANRTNNAPRSAEEPIPPATTAPGGGIFVAEPTAEPLHRGQAFISCDRNHVAPRSLELPLPTITTLTGGGISIVWPDAQPFVLGQQSNSVPRPADEPLPTIATKGAISVIQPEVEPFIIGQRSDGRPRSTEEPVPTVVASRSWMGLTQPCLIGYYSNGGSQVNSVDDPVPTIPTHDHFGLAEPVAESFIVPQFSERDGQQPRVHDVEEPLPAVTSHGAGALAEPVLVEVNHTDDNGDRVRSVERPLGTITTKRGTGLAEPVLVQTDQTGGNGTYARSVDTPLPTVVTKANIALAEPILRAVESGELDPRRLVVVDGVLKVLDIRFRMLTNEELARAMGFSDEEARYEFVGTKSEVTKQIGNAVPVNTAAALVGAILG